MQLGYPRRNFKLMDNSGIEITYIFSIFHNKIGIPYVLHTQQYKQTKFVKQYM